MIKIKRIVPRRTARVELQYIFKSAVYNADFTYIHSQRHEGNVLIQGNGCTV